MAVKKFLVLLLFLAAAILTGCSTKEESLNDNIFKLEAELSQLEAERERLKNEIFEMKIENGLEKYVVTFNIKQVHFSLDIGEHLKDSINDISIEIPVDKEYYDAVEVGDTIDDSFRMGSLIFNGSFGSWKVTVESKSVR